MKAGIRKNKLKKGFSYTVFVDYGIVNGSRKRESLETFTKKSIADEYKIKVQSEIDDNTFIHTPKITFSEAIDEWMKNYVENECEPNTSESYKGLNESYLRPYLGHYPLKVIGGLNGIDIINDYFHYLRYDLCNEIDKNGKNKKNLSYSTVKHHKAQISGIFTYFVNNKKLKTNICLNTKIHKTDEDSKKDTIIQNEELLDESDFEILEDEKSVTPQQAIIILNLCMNTCILLPVAFAILLGLRRSESLGILKSKLNKEERKVIINAVSVKSGTKNIFKKKNKNKTSSRILYMPKILLQIIELDEKRQMENKFHYGENYIESKFLCVMDNGAPIKPDYVSERFKKIMDNFIKSEKEKDPNFKFPHVTIHTLRHLNISALLENGAYLVDVQANSGHADIRTTIHYTHNYTQNKIQVADKTDEIYEDLIGIS